MAFYIIPQRYKVRGETAEILLSRNETLLDREQCLETDTGRMKAGDGETEWRDLLYHVWGFIDLSNLQDGQVPIWDGYRNIWVPGEAGSGGGGGGGTANMPAVMARISLGV